MPTLETFTPAQAAAILNVHANTVRAWTREYADVLSDSARGRPRLLTPRDVALMQIVVQLRAEGVAPDVVLGRLREVPDNSLQQPYIDVTAPAVEDSTAPTLPTAPATIDASLVLRDIASLVDARTSQMTQDVRKLDERVRQLESRRTLWVGVAIGLVLGLMVASGFILLRLP